MKQKATIQGRSMVFNILFVVINLCGLTLVVVGSHPSFEPYFLIFNFIGYLLLALSAGGLFIFQGRLMMANISRGIVGSVLIVSGLIKANDPIGFAYKLEEYFEDGALAYRIKELFGAPGFSLEFLIKYALILSVIICTVEILLGVLLIIGGKIKAVSYLLVTMMLFFTFLTWHTASCNPSSRFKDHDTYLINSALAQSKMNEAKTNKAIKIISKNDSEIIFEEMKRPQCVTDCGCFGDAMKGSVGRSLLPTESFWKDLIILYFSLWIFIAQWIITPNSNRQNIKFIVASILLISCFSWLFSWYFLIVFALILIVGSLWLKRVGGPVLGNYFGASLFVISVCFLLTTYILMYEPLKDYRPFAVGKNLQWEMHDGKKGYSEKTFILKDRQTGEVESYSEKEYLSNSDLWDEANYRFVKRKDKVIIPSVDPTITNQLNPFISLKELSISEQKLQFVKDFISKNPDAKEIAIKESIVKEKQIVLLTSLNLKSANWKSINKIKAIYYACISKQIPFVLVTSSGRSEINKFREQNNFNVPVFSNDEIGLKVIARSNPSLLVLSKGVVVGKFPHRSIPNVDWFKKNVLK